MNPKTNEILGDYQIFLLRKWLALLALLVLLILSAFISTMVGSSGLSLNQVAGALLGNGSASAKSILWNIRLPRILTAIVVGAALAISGCIMQCVLRNSLASASTLGVTQGASFGAAFAIVCLGGGAQANVATADAVVITNPYLVTGFAFLGGIFTTAIILGLSRIARVSPSTMVYDTALLGRRPYIKWSMSQEDLDICDRVMEQLGIESIKLRPINELSGGEVQKVMLARALVQQPKLLLLDEPTSNLDPRNQHEIMNLIHNMAKEQNFAVITVIHDLNLAARYCDRFLFMKDGTVFSYGGADAMTRDTIKSVYGIDAHIMECSGMPVIVPFLNLT